MLQEGGRKMHICRVIVSGRTGTLTFVYDFTLDMYTTRYKILSL